MSATRWRPRVTRAGAAALGECELVVLQGNYIKDGHQLTHPSVSAEAGEPVPCGGTSACSRDRWPHVTSLESGLVGAEDKEVLLLVSDIFNVFIKQ